MTPVSATEIASLKRRGLNLFCAFGAAALLLVPSLTSAQVTLGPTLQTFGVLAGSTVTNTVGPTVVTGNVGVSPGLAITGFGPVDGGPGSATGTYQSGVGSSAGPAQSELTTAFTAAGLLACNTTFAVPTDLSTLGTLVPGVYCFGSSAGLTGNLTLDFGGNPNANFLFKIGSTLITASNSQVLAINTGGAGCLPNINFVVGTSATLGTGTNFGGNILADQSITLTTGANLRGRALAKVAAVTLAANPVVGGCPIAAAVPGGPIPPPGGGGGGGAGAGVVPAPTLQEWALIFLGLMLAGVGGWQVRRKSVVR